MKWVNENRLRLGSAAAFLVIAGAFVWQGDGQGLCVFGIINHNIMIYVSIIEQVLL